MSSFVRFRLPDGSVRTLGHGDEIGRLWRSALFLDDARVSEAHALVSLRGDELRLLALRGRFTVDDRPVTEVALAAGQRVALAVGLELRVEEVVVPDAVLGVEGDGVPTQVLLGVASIVIAPALTIVPRQVDDAAAWIWSTGDGEGQEWHLRIRGSDAVRLEPGQRFVVHGCAFRAVSVPLKQASVAATVADDTLLAPITVVVRFATARIERSGEVIATFDGVMARLLTEVALFDGPAAWTTVAGEIWRKEQDTLALRARWDAVMMRLRRRLRDARVRGDLVRPDGLGNVSLHLLPGDQLVVSA